MIKRCIITIAAASIAVLSCAAAIGTECNNPVVDVYPVDEATEINTEEITQPELISLGTFRLTAYCPCSVCSGHWGRQTASGATATEGITIAVDPSIIPYGTTVVIDGHEYIAQDCGGAINGNVIDIYFSDHQACKNFGVQYIEVFTKGECQDETL